MQMHVCVLGVGVCYLCSVACSKSMHLATLPTNTTSTTLPAHKNHSRALRKLCNIMSEVVVSGYQRHHSTGQTGGQLLSSVPASNHKNTRVPRPDPMAAAYLSSCRLWITDLCRVQSRTSNKSARSGVKAETETSMNTAICHHSILRPRPI